MKDYIVNHYEFIVFVFICLVELFLLIFKKKVKVDTLKEKIYKFLPLCINLAEQVVVGSSLDKLSYAVDTCKKFLSIKDDSYDEFIISAIESILTTPTKKCGEGRKK